MPDQGDCETALSLSITKTIENQNSQNYQNPGALCTPLYLHNMQRVKLPDRAFPENPSYN